VVRSMHQSLLESGWYGLNDTAVWVFGFDDYLLLLLLLLHMPEHPIGSQHASRGSRVIERIRIDMWLPCLWSCLAIGLLTSGPAGLRMHTLL
jgi:hypothetical protein